jgi:3-demethoxyubiquinol 3-hydroxylase
MRHYTLLDKLCMQFDKGLAVLQDRVAATRANPSNDIQEGPLSADEEQHAAGLMRVNHVGEVCAQALYQGQAFTAKSAEVAKDMQQAADEENDHLLWCAERLKQLNSGPSLFNPFWYCGAYAMGAVAGFAGDKWSLGFVVETERQVEAHLNSHLEKLPANDFKSRAIVEQMRIDEAKHADHAEAAGAKQLPTLLKQLMRAHAKVMTYVAYQL